MPSGTDTVQTLEALKTIGSIVDTIGSTALLLWVIFLFIRGDLIPKKSFETAIRLMVEELKKAMEEAVHRGIVAAREDANREITDKLAEVSRAIQSRPCYLNPIEPPSEPLTQPRRRKE